MLVVTRRVDQEVFIGSAIRVVVLEISGKQVKLGIEAPQEVELKRTAPGPEEDA